MRMTNHDRGVPSAQKHCWALCRNTIETSPVLKTLVGLVQIYDRDDRGAQKRLRALRRITIGMSLALEKSFWALCRITIGTSPMLQTLVGLVQNHDRDAPSTQRRLRALWALCRITIGLSPALKNACGPCAESRSGGSQRLRKALVCI